jgi:hypothetical protein
LALSGDYSYVEKRMTEQKLIGDWMFWRSIQPVKESVVTVWYVLPWKAGSPTVKLLGVEVRERLLELN